MKAKFDLKSVITLMLVTALVVLMLSLTAAMIFGVITYENPIINGIMILFTNAVTSVLTFYFSKKKDENGGDNSNG